MYFLYDFVLTLFFRFCTLCILYTKEEVMKLKIYRESLHISQSEAASQLCVSKNVYNSWEYGVRIPRAAMMKKITEWTEGRVTANDFYLAKEEERK